MLYSLHNFIAMNKTVSIYSTPTCHFCQMTKDFLKENDIAYTEFDVAHDLDKRQEMIQRSGQMGVPVLDIDGQIIVGFDKDAISKALGLS